VSIDVKRSLSNLKQDILNSSVQDQMNTSISSKITTNTAASRSRAKKMWDVKTNLETVDEIKEKLRKQHNPNDSKKRAKSLNAAKSNKINQVNDNAKGDVGDLQSVY